MNMGDIHSWLEFGKGEEDNVLQKNQSSFMRGALLFIHEMLHLQAKDFLLKAILWSYKSFQKILRWKSFNVGRV